MPSDRRDATDPGSVRRVTILYRTIPHYRVAFYNGLRSALAAEGIHLDLIYGQPTGRDAGKQDTVDLPWATKVVNRQFNVGGLELIWQPALTLLRGSDLVIVEQANRLLVNYVLMVLDGLGVTRLALWGHGRNLQAGAREAWSEKVKRLLLRRASWWFAYTEETAGYLRTCGFPASRITSVNNAGDTLALKSLHDRWLRSEGREAARRRLGMGEGPIGIYCGSYYPDKRLSFLIEACVGIRRCIPGFEMVFVGAGPDVGLVEQACAAHEWIHVFAPRSGRELVPLLGMSDVILVPYGVGLVVVDSFAVGTPLVALEAGNHGPEAAYLQSGRNGLVVDANTARGYADAVVGVLADAERLAALGQGAAESASQYTVERMIDRFASGIGDSLEAERRWGRKPRGSRRSG
jgi:glycosyltransferase involved in cell wall biosynthesis